MQDIKCTSKFKINRNDLTFRTNYRRNEIKTDYYYISIPRITSIYEPTNAHIISHKTLLKTF